MNRGAERERGAAWAGGVRGIAAVPAGEKTARRVSETKRCARQAVQGSDWSPESMETVQAGADPAGRGAPRSLAGSG